MSSLEQALHPVEGSALSVALESASVPEGAHPILFAAAHLFARKGYGPTSVRTIAAEANVTVPMVYYYFEGKEQIFVTLVRSTGQHFLARVRAASVDNGQSFFEELVDIARVFRDQVHPCPISMQLMTQFFFGPPEGRPCIASDARYEDVTEYFGSVFRAAVDAGRYVPTPGYEAEELSMFFTNVIRGHMMCALKRVEITGEDYDTIYRECLSDETLERLVDVFLRGAGQASASA